MDMSGMMMMGGGMGNFTPMNMMRAKQYWYVIIAAVVVGTVAHAARWFSARVRKYQNEARSVSQPTVPHGSIAQAYATTLAFAREMSYPQANWRMPRGLRWLTPPSLGKCIVIFLYWFVVIGFLTSNAVIHDIYYYERIGFRAAWVSLCQVPLVVILSGKVNLIGMLVGTSYERINWLHRWVARTLFVTVTIHGATFINEWVKSGTFAMEWQVMYMVKWGLACWAVLLWINISGLLPIRSLAYEIFIFNHIASGAVFVYLLYQHVPAYAKSYVWATIAFLVFDRFARGVWLLYRNFRFRAVPAASGSAKVGRIGYAARLLALPGDVTHVTVENIPFGWKPGQHLYLWIPRIGMVESHPFTISNACPDDKKASALTLAVRAHGGFSRRLYRTAAQAGEGETVSVRAFIQGPFGAYPEWNTFESVLLISASTGASFTLPILESLIANPCCVRSVTFLMLVRSRPQCSCYLGRLRRVAKKASGLGIELTIRIAVTGSKLAEDEPSFITACTCGSTDEGDECCCGAEIDIIEERRNSKRGTHSREPSKALDYNDESKKAGAVVETDITEIDPEKADRILSGSSEGRSARRKTHRRRRTYDERDNSPVSLNWTSGRFQLSRAIRETVEEAYGETCVAVCGGRELTADVRNSVARLSDERAVHKGSGAQGIYLHVEEFGL